MGQEAIWNWILTIGVSVVGGWSAYMNKRIEKLEDKVVKEDKSLAVVLEKIDNLEKKINQGDDRLISLDAKQEQHFEQLSKDLNEVKIQLARITR